jgi:DNA mismatch repair protein MutL
MGKVQLLPENLVNQIAAGEVVERPASVVKELCENSLDAGARTVRVELVEGGLRSIVVEDDGCGMSVDDARSCLERHATSKLRDADGLKRIGTLGFRGEAIPAIASVSRFHLVTREPGAVGATRVFVDGGKLVSVEDTGAPAGTRISVEDLFFNTPARRKFLKRAGTEAGHASEALVRLALARPEIGFSLWNSGRESFSMPAGQKDQRERIAAALGPEVFKHLVPVDYGRSEVRISGQIASPDYTLATSRGLYTFVNGRFVRDRGLNATIQRAFADVTMPGRQPAAVLFIELPLEEVDVNVHPQKLEVRFADQQKVFGTVWRAVQEALRSSPWLAQRAAAASEKSAGEGSPAYAPRLPVPVPLPFAPRPGLPFSGKRKPEDGSKEPWVVVPEPAAPAAGAQAAADTQPPGASAETTEAPPPQGFFRTLRVIGQFAATYLVCEAPGPRLVIVDQHAAHERLKFHELREAFRQRKATGQAFLFPASVELPLAEARVLADHLEDVRAIGFEAEPFGGTSFALKAVPAPLLGCDYRKLLTDLAAELMQVEKGRAFDQAMDDVLATMACHAAVRAHQALSPEESRALLDALDAIDFNTRCPHGRPVAAEITLADLEKQVARR